MCAAEGVGGSSPPPTVILGRSTSPHYTSFVSFNITLVISLYGIIFGMYNLALY